MEREEITPYLREARQFLTRIRDRYQCSYNESPESILKRSFDSEYASLIKQQEEAWEAAHQAARNHVAAEKEAAKASKLTKALTSRSRNRLKNAKDDAREAAQAIDRQIHTLWNSYKETPELHKQALAVAQRKALEYQLKNRANALYDRLDVIESVQRRSQAFNPLFTSCAPSPETPHQDALNSIAEGILLLENYIADKLPEDEARSRCIASTVEILPANPECPTYPVGLEPTLAFWANAQDSLKRLASDPAGQVFPKLMEQMRELDSFGNDEQWIVFWSTVAANRHLYRKSSASEGEGALTGVWLDGWELQTSSWADDLVAAMRCRVAMTYSRLFDTKGDYETGSDVLMCFCSIRNDRLSIRLAWIQFKRGLTATDKLKVVHSEKFDQYKLLRQGHDPAHGSTSIYSQLTSVSPSLATTAALDVDEVQHAINTQQGYDEQTVGANQWRSADGFVNWQVYAEPLATKLARILRPHTATSAFSSLDDVRKWIEKTYRDADPGLLPAYWAVQVMGDDGVSLKHLHDLASEFHGIAAKLAEEFKLTFEEMRLGSRGRGRKPGGRQRDSGPSLD